MSVGFTYKDVMHNIVVKFVHAFLPGAKKPYNLKTVHQPELDIHGIASKADMYNIGIDPKVIEDGLDVGLKLIRYLAADGYKIKTPLFNLNIRVPGEYDGSETRLPDGVYPVARLQTSAAFRKYIRKRVRIEFDGVDQSDGHIGEAEDEAGLVDETMTTGRLLTIRGSGLKIKADEAHRDEAGLFFEDAGGGRTRARTVAVNEPKTLKAFVPEELTEGEAYTLVVVTQGSTKRNGRLLKEMRTIRSDFTLSVQA